MARSPHLQASGLGTVGQLRDGAVIGIYRHDLTGDPLAADTTKYGFNTRVRYYKNRLILEQITYSSGTTTAQPNDSWSIRGREFLGSMPFVVAMDQTTRNLFPTLAELNAMGLNEGGTVPIAITGAEIPFELTADYQIREKSLPVTTNDLLTGINTQTALTAAAVGGTTAETPTKILGITVNWERVWQVTIAVGLVIVLYKVGVKMKWFK